ncbi:Ribonuclease P protein subunit p29 [Paramyrothecium foliicola]|nr:Ribonuclease P protein subunit p29 [Paramyrothecium foliicola]
MATAEQQATKDLLARAHSPDSANRIYAEKIQYRSLHLRPTSPPPATLNARASRQRQRQQEKAKQKVRPKPLSSRQRKQLGLYDIPRDGQKYAIYEPLNKLWLGYAREVLGSDVHNGGPGAAAKLASAEFHGAEVEVSRSRCPGRVGIKGIVVRDRKFVFEIITKKRGLKVVPKEGTTFRVEVPIAREDNGTATSASEQNFVFEILGDQLMLRSADRANRKFKAHFLKNALLVPFISDPTSSWILQHFAILWALHKIASILSVLHPPSINSVYLSVISQQHLSSAAKQIIRRGKNSYLKMTSLHRVGSPDQIIYSTSICCIGIIINAWLIATTRHCGPVSKAIVVGNCTWTIIIAMLMCSFYQSTRQPEPGPAAPVLAKVLTLTWVGVLLFNVVVFGECYLRPGSVEALAGNEAYSCPFRNAAFTGQCGLFFVSASSTPAGVILTLLSAGHDEKDAQLMLPPPTEHAYHPTPVEPPTPQPTSYESGPARYTKEDLLDMFRSQKPHDEPTRLFIPGWNPNHVNGSQTRGWGKSSDNHVPQEPGACWDTHGETIPMGLQDLSAEEKEAFSTEINSPLKPPTQNKEGAQGNVNGRKASISQGTSNAYAVSSPSSATRPSTRRRETIESNPFSSALNSPTTAGRFSRDDPSYWFPRKAGESKEGESEEPDTDQARDASTRLPFGNLMRSHTTGSPGGMTSIWPPANQTTPGASGGFGNFAMPSPSAIGDKRVGGAAGGSRLAHLIPKDSSEAVGGAKPSETQNPMAQQSWRSRPRTDTDPFGDDGLSGSAVLGGSQDTSSAGPSQSTRVAPLGTPVKGTTGDFGMAGLNLGGQDDGSVSPSETNPYRSPPAERHDHDGDSPGAEKGHGAAPGDHPTGFAPLARGFGGPPFEGSDRSQTSSVGAKGYPLGAISGWPAPNIPSVGTPDRERANFANAFGSSLFSPIGDLQSPSLGNLNNVFGPASAGGLGTGSIGRGSKLGSLFPAAMQAQMQSHEQEKSLGDSVPDLRQSNPLGAIGRSNFPVPARDTDSPIRSNRGVFEELFPSSDASRAHGVFSPGESGQPGSQSFTPVTGGLPFGGGQVSGDPLAAQIRQMVMPDRMRWVYLDPQGQVQGPFTGLEMNDWYKAHFFTPDLRVKKVEDPEFEPLGQLIRRIGNSREPFLVPQIGIAHGPPTQSGPFTPTGGNGVVPPLSGVFPSFGRTLTAEEQNNLERRKQEEQFLMAQQREFVMRQQAMTKFQIPGPGLQHHSSAHSLQSQPSFGSMTSPIGAPPQSHQQQPSQSQQPIGAIPPSANFFDPAAAGQSSGRGSMGNGELFREEDLANLTNAERQMLVTLQTATGSNDSNAPQSIGATVAEAALRAGLPLTDQLQEDSEGFRERLREFEDLRAQHDAEQAAKAEATQDVTAADEQSNAAAAANEQSAQSAASTGKAAKRAQKKMIDDSILSLTQQVQKAQAAAAAAALPVEPDMPMPFPPPSSTTPLPAPTAQRVRSGLPEQYNRSQTGTPDTTTSATATAPPLAPWAKDPATEAQKGPSLKEIQEAEALKAAKAEEAAAALRKAALEQEMAVMREKEKAAAAAAAAASLPATSTWGHGSPVSATGSPWAKPAAPKGPAPGLSSAAAVAAGKKTLAEIQREEEYRKQRAREAAAAAGTPVSSPKSHATLASKAGGVPIAQQPTPPPGSGWATVGAGGKVKVPTGPASSLVRSVSATNIKPLAAVAKPVTKPQSINANGKADSGHVAVDEFNKWVNRELSRGITGVNDIASFQSALDVLPLDTGLIADAVYANSTTMDGRHFAEEYVRRKKLAEQGVVEKQPTDSKVSSPSGGWSEVAKKSGSGSSSAQPKEEAPMQAAGFKVVPGRKKGKK